jgi:growth factor-regulated tyrosine kinase substrate
LDRRHHCRSCGFVVCHDCSSGLAILPNLGYTKPVRICDVCFENVKNSRIIAHRGEDEKKTVGMFAFFLNQLDSHDQKAFFCI